MNTPLPPNAVEAEVAVISAMVLDNETIPTAVSIVAPSDFYNLKHQKIYQIILDLYKSNNVVDLVMVAERLKATETDDILVSYLTETVTQTIFTKNVKKHCLIIKEKAYLRNLIKLLTKTLEEAYTSSEAIDVIIKIKNELDTLLETTSVVNIESIQNLLENHIELLDSRSRGEIKIVKTGYTNIDNMVALEAGNLITIAGRTSMGKSAIALNIAYNMVKNNNVVGFFSLESSKQTIIDRLLAIDSEIDLWKIRKGKLNDYEYTKLIHSSDNLSKYNLLINDTANIDLTELANSALRMVNAKAQIIFIDYIGLVRTTKQVTREREVALVTSTLKALAKRLKVPVVMLSQLSRQIEYRTEKRPTLADLRESGAIEQDSDVVLLLHRKEYYGISGCESEAEIIIAKNRDGAIGTVDLIFDKHCVKFSEKEVI